MRYVQIGHTAHPQEHVWVTELSDSKSLLDCLRLRCYCGSMTKKARRRPQKQKSRSYVALAAIQSPARTYKSGAEYRRKPKHAGRGWNE